MILDDRPHTLQYLVSQDGYEDENGDYHPGESHWDGDVPCREVPAGRTEEKKFEDGVVRKYSSIIRLDSDCREFNVGDKVKVSILKGIVREYEVKGFHRYQTHSKLWV